MKKLIEDKTDIIAFVICIIFTLAAISVNLNRFWQYESGYYDFGIFDRSMWLISRFKAPIIDHFRVGGRIVFADHFSPSLYLFSVIYWFTSKSEYLFVLQDIFVGLSGFVLYLIGSSVLKNKFVAVGVLLAYFLFTGLQNAIFFDVHEVTVMTLPLMLVYWSIIKEKKILYFLFLVLTLGYKESLFLLGIGLSIFIFFYKKQWRKVATATFILSLIWGFLTIKVLIPYFSGGFYYYPPMAAKNIKEILINLVSPLIKVKTVFLTMLSFSFLPLFSPFTLPILLLNWIHRFLVESTTRWDLGLHYNAEIAPTLAVGTVLGLHYLKKNAVKFYYLSSLILVVISVVLYRFILHGPLALAYNPIFYQHTTKFRFLDKLVTQIPKDSTVIAQNNIAAYFTHHKNVWILRENYKKFDADYILFDLREGQNINNFLGAKDIKKIFADVKSNPKYKIYYQHGDQYIFKKI